MKLDKTSVFEHAIDPVGATFPALEDKQQRDSFLALIEAARTYIGIGKNALRTLHALARRTRPRDWTSSESEPVCYMRQIEIADEIGADERTVRRHERDLEKAGLIERRTTGNGARSRCGERGIVFTPAIRRQREIQDHLARREAERKEAATLRAVRSTLKSRVEHWLEQVESDKERITVAAELAGWPSAKKLRKLPLDALREHVSDAGKLADRLAPVKEDVIELSGPPGENVRSHTDDTIKDLMVSCNPPADRECCEEGRPVAPLDHRSLPPDWLTPRKIYALASQDLRDRIDFRKGGRFEPRWHDLWGAPTTCSGILASVPSAGVRRSQPWARRPGSSHCSSPMPGETIPLIPSGTPARIFAA